MDYKYIEQLLERYWQCETSVEEEKILQSFFSQKNVPESFLKYKDMFGYYSDAQENLSLGADFDEKMMNIVCQEKSKAKKVTVVSMLKPLLKAAAAIAVVLAVGNLAERSIISGEDDTNVGEDYVHTPQTYDKTGVSTASTKTTDLINGTEMDGDSLVIITDPAENATGD
jgi:hypothetical protein